MEKATNAVKNFLHKSGKEDSELHQSVAPAVKHENIERQQHEQVTTAVDKEVHQDHYHTTVQPVADREVLPEQHHHREAATERREFDHGNVDETQRRLHTEASKFQNTTTRSEGGKTASAAGATGQHTHHHIHETIQPVIEKQTIEPHVIHTVAPVHEVHHNAAQHHQTSTLPTVSMGEFERGGGSLTGAKETRATQFDGAPKLASSSELRSSDGLGTHQSSTGRNDNVSTKNQNASLMDKVNPSVDANKDGKKGFMS